MEPIEREIVIDAPASDVWPMLSDPAALSQWFGAEIEGELAPGHVLTFTWPDGSASRALVERVDALSQLAFRWLPFVRGADGVTAQRHGSRVEVICTEEDGVCRVRVVERLVGGSTSSVPPIGFRALARAGT